jgi:hypothetical protein
MNGGLDMLKKIEKKEIMTTREAMKKYRTQYFIMIITDVADIGGDNDLGYVIYTADKERELSQIPREEYKGKRAAFMLGGAAEPFPCFDRVVYHD